MTVTAGLDRVPGTPLEGMSDELWQSHTSEVQARFEAQQGGEGGPDLETVLGVDAVKLRRPIMEVLGEFDKAIVELASPQRLLLHTSHWR